MTEKSLPITGYFWLVLIAFAVALGTRRFKLPYALALVVTGLVIGIPRLLPQGHLEPDVLFTVFLPPLLFESAINLRIEPLRRDWKPIAVYTLAGTIASTFIVGGLSAWLVHLPLKVGLLFGALISTTDPISVIAIFKRLGAGRRLTLIMEAESLFNNDTAVVLFTVIMGIAAGGKISLFGSIGQFFQLVIGGAALGAGMGVLASRLHYELDDNLIEITLTSVVAFGAYLGAETLHVSGVMAVVVAGLVVGNYGMPRTMSPGTRLAVVSFWEYAAFVVNSIVFLLIGLEAAYVRWADKLIVVAGAIIIVLAGRAAIYPISLLINRWKGNIPLAWQHVLFWGGLRGALSMALVLGLPRSFPFRETLVASTFGVVLFSLLAQGSTLGLLLQRLKLSGEREAESPDIRRLAGEIMACRAALFELERLRAMETHPIWSIELLLREYRARLSATETALKAVQPSYQALEQQKVARARQIALTAEKSALRAAERQGWLEEEDWLDIANRIDTELIALRTAEAG